jgi:hypothetical protein
LYLSRGGKNCKNTNAEYATTSTTQSWENPGPTHPRELPLRTCPTPGDALNVECPPSSSVHFKDGVYSWPVTSAKFVDMFTTPRMGSPAIILYPEPLLRICLTPGPVLNVAQVKSVSYLFRRIIHG